MMATGKHTSYDDQRLGVSAVVRADVAGVSVTPYLEWGLEDSAGGTRWKVRGVGAGVSS